ncbi:MAG: transglutaminase-like domain-containing protein [Lachnospiraceae bacterium]
MDEISKQLVNVKDDTEKVKIVYKYITSNFKYDQEKASSIQPGYLPDLNDVARFGKAICYDYASLFAAVLRSNQIPTKLVMGYRNDMEAYHAWNEVLLDGKWVIIDTTVDSSIVQSGRKTDMVKDPSIFITTREH